jgi:FMNH2-dependent dimethyl sulfone monooxygenase
MIDEVASVKADARARGRDIDVCSQVFVTCRPTRAEAEDYVRHCIDDNADWDALDARLDGLRKLSKARPPEEELRKARALAPRSMIGIAVTGDPDDVAQGLANLATAGLRGLGMTFINFADELPYFSAEVLPRLQRMGLRVSP